MHKFESDELQGGYEIITDDELNLLTTYLESEVLEVELKELIANGFNPMITYRKSQDMRLSKDDNQIQVMAIISSVCDAFIWKSHSIVHSHRALTKQIASVKLGVWSLLILEGCIFNVITSIFCDDQSQNIYEIYIDESLLTPIGCKVIQALRDKNGGAITANLSGNTLFSGQVLGRLM